MFFDFDAKGLYPTAMSDDETIYLESESWYAFTKVKMMNLAMHLLFNVSQMVMQFLEQDITLLNNEAESTSTKPWLQTL